MNPLGTHRAQTDARLQERRQSPLPPWLATRISRRALALLPVATFGLGVTAATVGGPATPTVVGAMAVVGSVGLGALRRATRMLDHAPENLLDEREISDRDHAYRRGSRLTMVLLGVLAGLAMLNDFLVRQADGRLVESQGWWALTFSALLTAGMLPAAALAWYWRDPVDEGDDVVG
ncbi:hypothetical protein ACFFKU_17835 [Kineococcus gynurae]|uniref:Uncharacterized protein n=1 Tax=Kineococcus gynurae TaxID=452979 RepID=A0ABV5LNS6_9ACTN